MGNAELQTPAFLKDGTSDWHILKLACFGKGKQGYVFFGCFSREWDLTAEICHYSKYVYPLNKQSLSFFTKLLPWESRFLAAGN